MPKKKFYWIALIAAAGMFSTGQNQCQTPVAPFNVSGVYDGMWHGQIVNEAGEPVSEMVDCPLHLTFTHDPNLPFPRNLNGTAVAVIDFSCIDLPGNIEPAEASTVNMAFVLGADGKLISGAGGFGIGTGAFLALNGEGADANADGSMDDYAGDWDYLFVLALPGIPPFHIEGTFEIGRVIE